MQGEYPMNDRRAGASQLSQRETLGDLNRNLAQLTESAQNLAVRSGNLADTLSGMQPAAPVGANKSPEPQGTVGVLHQRMVELAQALGYIEAQVSRIENAVG